jgi:hypothetical protein
MDAHINAWFRSDLVVDPLDLLGTPQAGNGGASRRQHLRVETIDGGDSVK